MAPTGAVVALDVETVELLAERIAEKLEARTAARTGWVSADAVAVHLDVNVQWVYDHGYELGGVRLGDETTQGRWRFRLDRVDELLQASTRSSDEPPATQQLGSVERSRRRAQLGLAEGVDLLPVKGRSGSPPKPK